MLNLCNLETENVSAGAQTSTVKLQTPQFPLKSSTDLIEHWPMPSRQASLHRHSLTLK